MTTVELAPELKDMAVALGVMDAGGEIDKAWFGNPIAKIKRILYDPVQSAALARALDELAPPATRRSWPERRSK